MTTYKLLIEYDGTNLHGWQVQPDLESVQASIEGALEVVLGMRPNVIGSGRTDAGVHARGQVAHFCLESAVDARKLQASLNGLLPRSIRVLAASEADDGFHARYDAVLRTYHYYISTQSRALDAHMRWEVRPAPDFSMMNDAAAILLGQHDFSAFCRAKSETKNRVCRLAVAQWIPEAREGDWLFDIRGDRFLHGMVRTAVGTLLDVGRARISSDDLAEVLKSRDRRRAGQAAPARGLVLEHVAYSESDSDSDSDSGSGTDSND